LRPQHVGFETGYEIKKLAGVYIILYRNRLRNSIVNQQENKAIDKVGCLVEGTVMSQYNSLSSVTSGYVTPEDRTKPSSNSSKTKPTQHTNVNTLTLELAKPLSPL
jgi:hypothetical protein